MLNSARNIYVLFGVCLLITSGYVIPVFAKGTNQGVVSTPSSGTNIGRETKSVNLIPGDSSFETEVASSCVNEFRWAVTGILDESEKYDGRQSLKLRFPGKVAEHIRSSLIPITREQDGRIFTFSIYARADQDGIPGMISMKQSDGKHRVDGVAFNLTREWKRYSLTGQLKEGSYWLRFGAQTNNPFSVWVDAYQLEEGDKPTLYHNQDVNLGITIPSDYNHVFFPDELVKARIQAMNRKES